MSSLDVNRDASLLLAFVHDCLGNAKDGCDLQSSAASLFTFGKLINIWTICYVFEVSFTFLSTLDVFRCSYKQRKKVKKVASG